MCMMLFLFALFSPELPLRAVFGVPFFFLLCFYTENKHRNIQKQSSFYFYWQSRTRTTFRAHSEQYIIVESIAGVVYLAIQTHVVFYTKMGFRSHFCSFQFNTEKNFYWAMKGKDFSISFVGMATVHSDAFGLDAIHACPQPWSSKFIDLVVAWFCNFFFTHSV